MAAYEFRPPAPAQALKAALDTLNDVSAQWPAKGTHGLFSPQGSEAALQWYAQRATQTQGAFMMTFAFGMNDLFKDAYRNGAADLRHALMDKLLAPGVRKDKRAAAEAEILALRRQVANRFAAGNAIRTNAFDRWRRNCFGDTAQSRQRVCFAG